MDSQKTHLAPTRKIENFISQFATNTQTMKTIEVESD